MPEATANCVLPGIHAELLCRGTRTVLRLACLLCLASVSINHSRHEHQYTL